MFVFLNILNSLERKSPVVSFFYYAVLPKVCGHAYVDNPSDRIQSHFHKDVFLLNLTELHRPDTTSTSSNTGKLAVRKILSRSIIDRPNRTRMQMIFCVVRAGARVKNSPVLKKNESVPLSLWSRDISLSVWHYASESDGALHHLGPLGLCLQGP